jgi:hypothetical protein
MPHASAFFLAALTVAYGHPCRGVELRATPDDYVAKISQLHAGDVLRLAPGNYAQGLSIVGLSGSAEAPIRVVAEHPRQPPTFVAQHGRNTISIVDSSYVEIDRLDLDGRNLDVDAVKAEGHARYADHITLFHLRIRNYGRDQQTVGISTKCPAWGWRIEGNEIIGVGTGVYLGSSDGSAPFVGGLIAGNLILNTTGYNVQIKHQLARPSLPGMPTGRQRTIIRDNVLSKGDASSTGEFARPNLLVGHFPIDSTGHDDEYLIYGNFIYDNPSEALLQAEGNVSIYNNVLMNPRGNALAIQPHYDRPRNVRIFGNTIVAKGTGIQLQGIEPGVPNIVVGNVVFADPAIIGHTASGNLTGAFDRASRDLRRPYSPVGKGLDVTPLRRLPTFDYQPFGDLPASAVTFDGRPRKRGSAGAYEADEKRARRGLALERKRDRPSE